MQRRTIETGYIEETYANYKQRITTLNDVYGQEDIVKELREQIGRRDRNSKRLDNILLVGYEYNQAERLVGALAAEMEVGLRIVDTVEKPGDMAALLNGCKEWDILFFRSSKIKAIALEPLLSAMGKSCINLVIGKGITAKSIQLELPDLTYICYTEKESDIRPEISDRCPNMFLLHELSCDEKKKAVMAYCDCHELTIDQSCVSLLSNTFESWIQLEKYLDYLAPKVVGRGRRISIEEINDSYDFALRLNNNGAKHITVSDNLKMPSIEENRRALIELLSKDRQSIKSCSSFRKLCKESFSNTLAENLLIIAYDAGIMSAIEDSETIDIDFINGFVNYLVQNYGLTPSAATWSVSIWANAMGELS